MAKRWWATAGLALAALAFSGGYAPAEPPAERLFPPPSPERVAELLTEIARHREPQSGASAPMRRKGEFAPEKYEHVALSLTWADVEELALAEPSVDADLLRLARTGDHFDVRCRAALCLAMRSHAEAPPILAALTRSELAGERYVAWRLCDRFARPPSAIPVPAAEAINHMKSEPENDVVERMIDYVVSIGARGAIPLLMDWVHQGQHSHTSVWALGALRATEAVPLILERRPNVSALGRIGTKEAVDYVIAHIEQYGAIDALIESGDPRAAPSIEAFAARLRAGPMTEWQRSLERDARIALLRLRSKDPCASLLDFLEDSSSGLELRREAAVAIRMWYPKETYERRLPKVYARENDPEILWQCEHALDDSRAPGVTEAMLHHAQVWKPWLKDVDPTPLVRSIGRRLGMVFKNLDEVRALATSRGIK